MRKKIGKRIGPAPIALVAVLALAAFVSAGLWLVPGGNQTAEAQSIQSVVIDVNEAMLASTPTQMGNAAQVRSVFSRADGDSVTYRVVRIDDDMVADTNNDNTNDDIDLGGLGANDFVAVPHPDDDNVVVVTLPANLANMTGTRYVYVMATYVPPTNGTAQDPVTLVFMLTVVQNPIEVGGAMVTNPDGDTTTDGVQWPDGKCTVGQNTAGSGLVTRNNEANPPVAIVVASPTNLVSAGDCLSSDDEVDVSFTNANESAEWVTIVYVTGGDDITGVAPDVAAEGLGEHVLRVPAAFAGDDGEETITVTRSMGDSSGIVYLVGYSGDGATGATTNNNLTDDVDTTFGGDAAYVIKAVFLDPPVEKDADGNTVSEIKIMGGDVDRNTRTAMAEIQVRDANNHPVPGFIDLTIEGPDSVVFTASNLKTHRTKLGSDGTANVAISGLPKTDPFKINITGTIGDLTIDTDVVRKGDAEMVEATAYACSEDRDDGDDGVCASEIKALGNKTTGDDPSEVVALGPGDSFVIGGTATDSAGNNVGGGSDLTWEIYGDADNADEAEETLASDSGRTHQMISVSEGESAVPGTYTLTVKSPDGEASTMVTIIVSDDASVLTVSCDPEMVTTDSGVTDCTVTVTDENGNIPSNLIHGGGDSDDASRVLVIVRSEGASLSGVDTGGYTDLDATGMASFSVVLREDAREGYITVFVSTDNVGSTTLRATTTVMYGEAQPEMMAPGMPMNVMAMATSHDMITVSWESPADDGGSDITGYMVQRGYMDADNMMMWMDVDPAHMGMDMMYMDMGLMAETTYYYRVAAMNSSGMGDYSDGMAMAMTMAEGMPTDGEMLTSPSGVDAASLPGTGAVSVSWTPGQNATQHWVVLFSLPGYDVGGRVEVLNDPDANFQVFKNVPNGEYEVVVASYDPDTGFQYQDGIGMVTVE